MMTIVFVLLCLLFVALCQSNESAFACSKKYSETDNGLEGYLHNIVHGFYHQSLRFSLFLRLFSSLLVVVGFALGYNYAEDVSQQWGNTSAVFWLVLFAIWLGYLVLGYLMPRYLGRRYPDVVLYHSAFVLNICFVLLSPLTFIVLELIKLGLRLFRVKPTRNLLLQLVGIKASNQQKNLKKLVVEEEILPDDDAKIFRNAVEFSSVRVKDCIVPRTEIVAVEEKCSAQDLLTAFTKSGKTKIIVYQGNLDHIIGYIHSSEMFGKRQESDWTPGISEIPIVPESMTAQKMMQIFRKQKKSLAVVVDEYGGTSGIISLEDLVEEIFGDIEDEHDTSVYTAQRIAPDEYQLSARLEIEKVNDLFDLQLPISDEYMTIGGLILYHNEDIPQEGQTVTIGRYQFSIIRTTRSKIQLVRLKIPNNAKK